MKEVSKEKYNNALKHFDITSSVGMSEEGCYTVDYVKIPKKRGQKHQQGRPIGRKENNKYFLENWVIQKFELMENKCTEN